MFPSTSIDLVASDGLRHNLRFAFEIGFILLLQVINVDSVCDGFVSYAVHCPGVVSDVSRNERT